MALPSLNAETILRHKRRATESVRRWAARQLLTIDCRDVGGRSVDAAIPLQHVAGQPERYGLMLRYARGCFGTDWRLDRVEQSQRQARCLECLVIVTPDEQHHRLWFDVTPPSN